MPSVSSAANSPPLVRFPPRQRVGFHETVPAEIPQERVVSSRNRRNQRGVKRKMSKYPIRRKTDRALPAIDVARAIQIAK
jgi:hypothetical protein